MDTKTFRQSLGGMSPPVDVGPALAALWQAAKGDWNAAHHLVQDESSAEAAWVHAYLHRVEGDLGNAGYWYRRAGKQTAKGSLEEEWETIAASLLTR